MRQAQIRLAEEGATDLLVKLLHAAGNRTQYLEVITFGIALLEGGNVTVQVVEAAATEERGAASGYSSFWQGSVCVARSWGVRLLELVAGQRSAS